MKMLASASASARASAAVAPLANARWYAPTRIPDDSAASRLAAKYGSGPHCAGLTVQSAPLPRLAWTKANLIPEVETVGQSIPP